MCGALAAARDVLLSSFPFSPISIDGVAVREASVQADLAFRKRSMSTHAWKSVAVCAEERCCVYGGRKAGVWADSALRVRGRRLKSFRSVWATGQDLISTNDSNNDSFPMLHFPSS